MANTSSKTPKRSIGKINTNTSSVSSSVNEEITEVNEVTVETGTFETEDNIRVAQLEKENKALQDQISQLMTTLEKLQKTVLGESESEKEVYSKDTNKEVMTEDFSIPDEPSPNKMVRIVSLCRGSLNLAEDESGSGKIKFSKYGETKTVLYSSLINIVNHDRSFAEKGYFYILDNAAVYYLGLRDFYSKLLTKDVLDNICKYEDVDINKIIESAEPSQVETMVKNLADRIFNGEKLDLNKIETISKKSGRDILSIVNEMRGFSNIG